MEISIQGLTLRHKNRKGNTSSFAFQVIVANLLEDLNPTDLESCHVFWDGDNV